MDDDGRKDDAYSPNTWLSPERDCSKESTVVEIKGVQDSITIEDLQLYFETPKSAGRRGSVLKCVIEEGKAYVEFNSPEVAANVIKKGSHDIAGDTFTVHYPSELSATPLNSILISHLPPNVDLEFLKRKLEMPIGHSNFTIEQLDDCSAKLDVSLPNTELEDLMKKLNEVKIKTEHILASSFVTKSPSKETADDTDDVKPTRFCHVKLLVSKVITDHCSSSNAQSLIENTIKCTKNSGFKVECQEDNVVIIFEECLSDAELTEIVAAINKIKVKNSKTPLQCVVSNIAPELPLEILVHGFASRNDKLIKMHVEDTTGLAHGTDFTFTHHHDDSVLIQLLKTHPKKDLCSTMKKLRSSAQKLTVEVHQTLSEKFIRPFDLLISNLPSHYAMKDVVSMIEKVTKMKNTADFIVATKTDSTVKVTFRKKLSDQDCSHIISLINEEKCLGTRIYCELSSGIEPRQPFQILISNIPKGSPKLLKMRLEDYFEKEHGNEITLEPQKEGNALLTMGWSCTQKELEDVIAYIEKQPIKGQSLKAELYKSPVTTEGLPMLLITSLSPIDEHTLTLVVEAATQKDKERGDFVLDMMSDCSAKIIFQKHLTQEELQQFRTVIEQKSIRKGEKLKVEIYEYPITVHVRNITERVNYDEEVLRYYFGSAKRSGGGEIKSLELLGNGEAIVEFFDRSVLKRVLQQTHSDTLGASVVLEQETTTKVAKPDCVQAIPLNPVTIPFPTKIANIVKNDLTAIQDLLHAFHVTAEMNGEAMLLLPSKEVQEGWENVCRDTVKRYIEENVLEVQLDISEKALAMLLPTVIELQKTQKCLSYLPVPGPTNTVYSFIGERSTIQKIKGDLDKINNSITVTTEHHSFDEKLYTFLFQVKKNTIEMANPGVEIIFKTPDTISAHGVIEKVKGLWSYISTIHYSSIIVDITDMQILEFLHLPKGHNELKLFINDHCPNSVATAIYRNVNGMILLCDPGDEPIIRKLASDIKDELCCQHISIGESSMSLLLEEKVHKEFDEFCEQHNKVLIKKSNQKVAVVGFKQSVQDCRKVVVSYIEDKCKVRKTIEVPPGVWRLFQGPLNSRWKKILDTKMAKITCPKGSAVTSNHVVIIEGCIENVQHIFDQIIKLKEKVVIKQILESQPGLREYMQGVFVRTFIHGIESEHKVCIECNEDTLPPSRSVHNFHSHREVFAAYTKEHKKICVCIGDITEFRADVLVNAANRELKHFGGVAKAFVDKGGPVIQESCDKYTKRKKLEDGQVWLTTEVGSLPCKALVHAVAPKFQKGAKCEAEKKKLLKAYYNAMEEANSQGYHSIAFPAISTGVYDCPYGVSVQKWIEAVIGFGKKLATQTLHDIYLIAKDTDAANIVVGEIKSRKEDFVELCSSPVVNQESPKIPVKLRKPNLKVLKQSMLETKADVYVNTTNTSLCLSNGGAISSLLVKAAGPQLQQECDKKAPIAHGDVVVTAAGGNLKCQKIFHIALPNYVAGESEKVLYKSMEKCFIECNHLKYSTIAFPALGTGTLQYPRDSTSKLMIKATFDYMSKNPNTSITGVYFPIYKDDDLYGTFQCELSKFPTAIPTGASSTTKRAHISDTSSNNTTQGVYKINNITVNIIKGDITDERTDVIVHSASPDMKLEKTAVGKALLIKVGPPLQKECDEWIAKIGELKDGAVACTHACNGLKCKAVIHVKVDHQDSISTSVCACLREAESKKYSSISFPALGTGGHKLPSDVAAEKMLEGIQLFSSSQGSGSLNTVQIIICLPEIYKVFLDTFNKSNKSQSWWRTNVVAKGAAHAINWAWGRSESKVNESEQKEEFLLQQYEDVSTATVVLNIYGETDDAVNAAESKVYEFFQKSFQPRSIENPIINDLSETEVEELKKFADNNNVTISIRPNPICEITLKGEATNVTVVYSHVQDVLAKHEKQKLIIEQAERLLNTIEWQYENPNGTFSSYDMLQNYEIEKQYELDSSGEYTHDNLRIDFASKQHYDANGRSFRVQRLNKSIQQCPPHWSPMPLDKANREVRCHLVTLNPSSPEYKQVMDAFSKTMTQGQSYNKIVQIQCVQNPVLYHQYDSMKTAMRKQNPPNHQNEKKLFHGTAADTCDKINAQGFNRSFAGKNAIYYGRGVYFARDASYSAQDIYSPPDSKGNKHMYFAAVLTGEYTVGNSNTIVPPAKDPINNPNVPFDSTVEKIQDPNIFVTYNDAQAYPEYLITFN